MAPRRATAAATANSKAKKSAGAAAKDNKGTKAASSTATTATTTTKAATTDSSSSKTQTKTQRASRKRAAPAEDESVPAEGAAPKPSKRVKTSAAASKEKPTATAKEAKEAKKPKQTAKEAKKEAPKAKETRKKEKKEKEKDTKEKELAAAPKRAKAVPKSRAAAAAKVTKVTKTTTTKAAKATKADAAVAAPSAPKAAPATKPREPTPVAPPPPAIINKIPTTRFEVWSFGSGTVGELGVGPDKNSLKTPRPITALDVNSVGIVQVSPGGMHVAALTHDGKIYTWGQNDNAALGRDTTWEGGKVKDMDADDDSDSDDELNLNPKEATPAVIPDGFLPEGTKVAQVAAGDCATFALTDTGFVYGWGIFRNENGSWGFYRTADKTAKKQAIYIAELKNIVQIAAGDNFALALAQDGTVYSWGDGAQGQLGRQLQPRSERLRELAPSLDEASLTPHALPFPKRKIVSIHAASNHSFAIDKTGGVWAWGLNNYSQTGISDHAGESEAIIELPRRVTSLKGYHLKLIDGGSQFSIGLTEDGKCLTWGRMDGSQIGVDLKNLPVDDDKQVMKDERGKPRIMLKPANVEIKDCTWVAAGSDHSIAVAKDGKAYAWGFNEGYRCALGDDSVDDVVEPHRIENKLMKDKNIVWAGAGGQYSLVGIEPETEPQNEAASSTEKAAEEERKEDKQEDKEGDKREDKQEEEQKTEEKSQADDKKEEEKDDKDDKKDENKDEDEKMEDAPPATTGDADKKTDAPEHTDKDAGETAAASS